MEQKRDLFELMMKHVKQTADEHGDKLPQGFARWFSKMYFGEPSDIFISDGTGDGKVDVFISLNRERSSRYVALNSKFTKDYDKTSPVAFYDEITRFWQAFENKQNRKEYLNNAVRPSLRNKYNIYFKHYDEGKAKLFFLTNHKKNEKQF